MIPGQLRTDENRAQDGQRRQLNGSSVDEGLKNVVLELLVRDEEDDHDEAAEPAGLDDDHGRDDDRCERCACQRDEIEHRDEEAERDRELTAEDEEHHGGQRSGDHADEQISGDVARDGLVDVTPDPLVARPCRVGKKVEQAPHGARSVEEHEEREEDDRDGARDDR